MCLLTVTALFTGCGIENPYNRTVQYSGEKNSHNVFAASLSKKKLNETYTVEDVKALRDFLVCRDTEGGGKDYDLDGNGKLNVFDLCIMERMVLDNMETNVPVVYMTEKIDSDSLMKIYGKLDADPTGNVAVKISTGESERSNHLSPDLIKEL